MKKILSIVMAAMLVLPGMAAADELEATELYEVNNDELMLVTSSVQQAVYATDTYVDGFFDRYRYLIATNNFPQILTDNIVSSTNNLSKGTYTVTLNKQVDITGIYIYLMNYSTSAYVYVDLYNQDNLLKTINISGAGDEYVAADVKSVDKVVLRLGDRGAREFEFFIDPSALYASVSNLSATTTSTDAVVRWTNPADEFFATNKVYLNDNLVATNKMTSYKFEDLEPATEYKVTVAAMYGDIEVKKDHYFTTKEPPPDRTPPAQVTNLQAIQDGNNIKLTFTPPNDTDFSHVQIQRGTAYLDKEFKDTTYIDTSPNENKLNNYSVRSVDKSGNVSMAATTSIMHDTGEVKSLKAVAPDFTNVQLQWENTKRSDFEVVKIYRKSADAPIMRRVMNLFSANDGFTPLFETNGTTFKDLTVAPESEYTYKVTSVVDGSESAGVVTTITTPKVSVIGSEIDPPPSPQPGQPEDPEAPYVITWQQPTTGKILVKVGGVDYRLVDAADLSISIPKSDMKYTFMGAPDVQLVPIDEDGNAGLATKPGGSNELGTIGSLPEELSAGNLLSLGIGLLKWVGPFVLLYLVFLIAAYLIGLLRNAIFPPKEKPKKTTKGTKGTSKGSTRGTSKRTTTVKKAPARSTVKQPAAKPEKVAAARAATRQANIAKVRPTAAKAVGAVDKPVKFARSTRRG